MPRQGQFPVRFSDNRLCYRSSASPGFICVIALVAFLSGYACLCQAATGAETPQALGSGSTAFGDAPHASDEELDRMRGGFVVSWNGLEFLMPFSITGIERLTQINGQTYINGELMSASLNPRALTPFTQMNPISVSVRSEVPADANSGLTEVVTVPMSPPLAQTASGSGETSSSAGAGSGSATDSAGAGSATGTGAASGTAASNGNSGMQVTTNGSLIVIQNGVGNTVALPANMSSGSLATFIQNSVNNQVIRNITTLNITLNAQMLAAQARLNALNQSLNSLR
ncbi:MAG: hypothetical protein Q8K62_02900 [Thiobacillus sp.]|nr:hypothetical protein [Thiobacillus sp.]